MNAAPQTEINRKREALWSQHFRPGIPLEEVFRLNAMIISLYPKTPEERDEEAKGWEGVPAFEL